MLSDPAQRKVMPKDRGKRLFFKEPFEAFCLITSKQELALENQNHLWFLMAWDWHESYCWSHSPTKGAAAAKPRPGQERRFPPQPAQAAPTPAAPLF